MRAPGAVGTFKIWALETSCGGLHFGIKIDKKTFGNLEALSELCREENWSPKLREEIFNHYLRPERCNLASVDTLCISKTTAKSDTARVYLLQITSGAEHAVKASGLKGILKTYPRVPGRERHASCCAREHQRPQKTGCHTRQQKSSRGGVGAVCVEYL